MDLGFDLILCNEAFGRTSVVVNGVSKLADNHLTVGKVQKKLFEIVF